MPSNQTHIKRFAILALILFSSAFEVSSTEIFVHFKGKDVPIQSVENGLPIVSIKGVLKTVKPKKIRLRANPATTETTASVNIEKCAVYLKSFRKEEPALIDLKLVSEYDLKDAFVTLSTEETGVLAMWTLPQLKAKESVAVSFECDAKGVTIGVPVRFHVFSQGKGVNVSNRSAETKVNRYKHPPQAILLSNPVFPEGIDDSIKTAKIQVAFTILPSGKAGEIEILESPDPAFSQAVIEALERSRYSPLKIRGEPKSSKIKQWVHLSK